MSNDNVRQLFPEKKPITEPPQVIIDKFHSKLDEVMGEFQTLGVMEKYEVMLSICEMNKNLFQLYMDLRKRYDFNIDEIINGDG
jgi:hypothetical protein